MDMAPNIFTIPSCTGNEKSYIPLKTCKIGGVASRTKKQQNCINPTMSAHMKYQKESTLSSTGSHKPAETDEQKLHAMKHVIRH
jgi:hypothetical protein